MKSVSGTPPVGDVLPNSAVVSGDVKPRIGRVRRRRFDAPRDLNEATPPHLRAQVQSLSNLMRSASRYPLPFHPRNGYQLKFSSAVPSEYSPKRVARTRPLTLLFNIAQPAYRAQPQPAWAQRFQLCEALSVMSSTYRSLTVLGSSLGCLHSSESCLCALMCGVSEAFAIQLGKLEWQEPPE